MKTYDVRFDDDRNSNIKGFELTLRECKDYIETRNDSYFEDYKGGTVSIIENESGETVFETNIF